MQKGRPEKAAPFFVQTVRTPPGVLLTTLTNLAKHAGGVRTVQSVFAANRHHALDGEPRLRCDSRIDFDLVFHSLQ